MAKYRVELYFFKKVGLKFVYVRYFLYFCRLNMVDSRKSEGNSPRTTLDKRLPTAYKKKEYKALNTNEDYLIAYR